jgi:hypothetical protein
MALECAVHIKNFTCRVQIGSVFQVSRILLEVKDSRSIKSLT